MRVRPAHDDFRLSEPRAEEWLLAEWPEGEDEPTKYWLSTLPETATLEELVATAKLRWRIERDFEELKQELGLGHFEGRGWRGFHHHAVLVHRRLRLPGGRALPLFPPGLATPARGPRAAGRLPAPGLLPCARSGTARRSIATLRRHLAVALMRRLPRCPCCLRAFEPPPMPVNS